MNLFPTRWTKPAPWASPHTSHAPALLDQFSLTQSLLCQSPNQAQHSRCVPQYPREEHHPSPLPAGRAWAGTAQQERLLILIPLPVPCKSFHGVSPQPVPLHSCHMPRAGSKPCNTLLGPQFISHCSPSTDLLGLYWRITVPKTMKDSSQK